MGRGARRLRLDRVQTVTTPELGDATSAGRCGAGLARQWLKKISRMPPSTAAAQTAKHPYAAVQREALLPVGERALLGGLRRRLLGAAGLLLGDHGDRVGELGRRDDRRAARRARGAAVRASRRSRRSSVASIAAMKTCTNAIQSMTIIAAVPSWFVLRRRVCADFAALRAAASAAAQPARPPRARSRAAGEWAAGCA